MSSGKNKNGSMQPRRYWSPHEEKELLDALKTLCTSGWKCNGGFKGGYLTRLETMLAAKYPNARIEARHIKSKIHVWKKDYGHVIRILGTGDGASVTMDPVTNMIIMESDSVWAEYVKVHKEARKLKGRPLPYYKSWVEIFGNNREQGNEAVDVGDALHELLNGGNCNSTKGGNDFLVDSGQASRTHIGDDVFDDANSNTPPFRHEPNAKSTSSGVKRKRVDVGVEVIDSMMGRFIENTTSTLGELTSRLKPFGTVGTSRQANESDKRESLYAAISEIDGLTMEEQLRATHRLALNSHEMDAFWGMPKNVRKEYIRLLLSGTI